MKKKATVIFLSLILLALFAVTFANEEKDRSSLKKKIYEYNVSGTIGESKWSKRDEVPGVIVDREIEKLEESHTGALCSYGVKNLTPNIFKVTVDFCGALGTTASGKIRVTIYYSKK